MKRLKSRLKCDGRDSADRANWTSFAIGCLPDRRQGSAFELVLPRPDILLSAHKPSPTGA